EGATHQQCCQNRLRQRLASRLGRGGRGGRRRGGARCCAATRHSGARRSRVGTSTRRGTGGGGVVARGGNALWSGVHRRLLPQIFAERSPECAARRLRSATPLNTPSISISPPEPRSSDADEV